MNRDSWIIFGLAVLIMGGLLYWGLNRTKTASNPVASGMNRYTSSAGKFTIDFPQSGVSEFSDPAARKIQAPSDYPGTGVSLADFVGFYIDNSDFPKTNFSEAEIDAYALTGTDCQASIFADDPNSQTTTATINGVTFKEVDSGDAAAGNRYATTFYQTQVGDICYELSQTVHTTVLENYDPSSGVMAYDPTKLNILLNSITQSFRVTK